MSGFVQGEGPALVLMHGVGLDHTMWQPLADRLAQRRKVVAFDLPGHGKADGLVAPATLAQFTARIWQEMERLELEKIDLCGFSMGVMIAQAGRARAAGGHWRSDPDERRAPPL